MASKRGPTPTRLISNPFIKKRNLDWNLGLSNLIRDDDDDGSSNFDELPNQKPLSEENISEASAVEAGKVQINDHVGYFSDRLRKAALAPFPSGMPQLLIENYRRLYESNAGSLEGSHFIIHQHDHPIAGTHYDLRLQINKTSSVSWAIMYGLPGDPNSQRLNRNATETRIHCLWNHLIETASMSTGSLLIWDMGTYSVLPHANSSLMQSSSSDNEEDDGDVSPRLTEQEKLHRAFQSRKIRLRLHGAARLPHDYVLNLRLTREEDAAGRIKSGRTPTRRRRRGGRMAKAEETTRKQAATSSDSESTSGRGGDASEIGNAPPAAGEGDDKAISAMEREIRELEDEEVRRTNAYSGADNSIGSVHQRRWYLSLDRTACGFVKRRKEGRVVWEAEKEGKIIGVKGKEVDENSGRLAYPFYVRGVEVERSVLTGRTGAEVLRDEGVKGYVGRKGWQPVLK